MKTTTRWMAGLVALTMAGALHAAPASADSVRTLMDLTAARGMVEGMMKNLEATIRQGAASSIAQQSGGQPMTAAQQASLDRLIARMTDLLTKSLRWEDLEPDYIRLYVDTFDQDEIDGMIAFSDDNMISGTKHIGKVHHVDLACRRRGEVSLLDAQQC